MKTERRRIGKMMVALLLLAVLVLARAPQAVHAQEETPIDNAISNPIWFDVFQWCELINICAAMEGITLEMWTNFAAITGALDWSIDNAWEFFSTFMG